MILTNLVYSAGWFEWSGVLDLVFWTDRGWTTTTTGRTTGQTDGQRTTTATTGHEGTDGQRRDDDDDNDRTGNDDACAGAHARARVVCACAREASTRAAEQQPRRGTRTISKPTDWGKIPSRRRVGENLQPRRIYMYIYIYLYIYKNIFVHTNFSIYMGDSRTLQPRMENISRLSNRYLSPTFFWSAVGELYISFERRSWNSHPKYFSYLLHVLYFVLFDVGHAFRVDSIYFTGVALHPQGHAE